MFGASIVLTPQKEIKPENDSEREQAANEDSLPERYCLLTGGGLINVSGGTSVPLSKNLSLLFRAYADPFGFVDEFKLHTDFGCADSDDMSKAVRTKRFTSS